MKKVIISILTIIFGFVANAQEIKNISVEDFYALQLKNKLQILDVRTEQEFESGKIKNAINIDVNARDFEKQIKYLDSTKPLYVYCLSGGRSKSACDVLLKNNFKNLYNVTGGIMQWRQKKLPLVNAAPQLQEVLTLNDYNKLVNQTKPVLVEFYATWCGPCKILKPIVEDIKNTNVDKLDVIFIDVDKESALADALKIGSIPELRYYVNGKQKFKLLGMQSKKTLLKKMKL